MRTPWLESLIITLGLTSLGFVACKGDDDGGSENADENGDGDGDGDSSESAESTMTGDGDTTSGDGDTTTSDTSCLPGELGCECNDGLCLGDLVCNDGICSDPDCIPGELACECNDGLCLGNLVCVDGVCLEEGGTTTDTDTTADTDTTEDTGMQCPNPNEMMCGGECVDVLENNEHCGECGNTCEVSPTLIGTCEDGACGPTWSDCYGEAEGYTTCDEICAAEGTTCAFEGCNNDTWMTTDDHQACLAGLISGDQTPGACDDPLTWGLNDVITCCCFQ